MGGYTDGKPCVDLQVVDNLMDLYLEMIPGAVEKILAEEGIDISEVDFFLPPQSSPKMNRKLPNLLGVEPHRFIDIAREESDLYSSALPYSFEYLQKEKLASKNEVQALKGTASSLRDELEKSKFDMAEAIQKEKLGSSNAIKALKATASSLRDELEKSKYDMAEAVQAEKLASTGEIKALKGTVASLREKLEKK